MFHRIRKKGQAIVEFALAGTLIFFLLVAAVDLGLIFFTVQGLNNAAQEGATYGSRWLINEGNQRVLNQAAIRERVRMESGDRGGIGFVNLLDLNNDGQPDDAAVLREYIEIYALADPDFDGNPLNNGTAPNYTPCVDIARSAASGISCYIRVVVHYEYRLVFPLAPAFGETIRIRSAFIMPIRDSFQQGGAPSAPPSFNPAPPPESLCTVPNLAGVRRNAGQDMWTQAGFVAGNYGVLPALTGNFIIGTQNPTAGQQFPCQTQTMTVGE